MKKHAMTIMMVGITLLLFGDTESSRKEKQLRLMGTKMAGVITQDGFEYFSGYLDTSEYPQQFISTSADLSDLETVKEFLILSDLNIQPGAALHAAVTRTENNKCQRCWRHQPSVGDGDLCDRCQGVLA
jgi:hypothetical protein